MPAPPAVAAAIAFFAALVLWSKPGTVLKHSFPDAGELVEFLRRTFADIEPVKGGPAAFSSSLPSLRGGITASPSCWSAG